MKRLIVLLAPFILSINILAMDKPGFTYEQQQVLNSVNETYNSVFKDLDLVNGLSQKQIQDWEKALNQFDKYLDKYKNIKSAVFAPIKTINQQIIAAIKDFSDNEESSNFKELYCQTTKKLSEQLISTKLSINKTFENKGLAGAYKLSLEIIGYLGRILESIKEDFRPEGLRCSHEIKIDPGQFVPGLNETSLINQIDNSYQKVFGNVDLTDGLKNSVSWDKAIDNIILFVKRSGIDANIIKSTNQYIESINNNIKNDIKTLVLNKPNLDSFYTHYQTLIPRLSQEVNTFNKFISSRLLSVKESAVKNVVLHTINVFEKILNKTKEDFSQAVTIYDKAGIIKRLNNQFQKIMNLLKIIRASKLNINDPIIKNQIQDWKKALVALQIFIDKSESKDFPKLFPEIVQFNDYIFETIFPQILTMKITPNTSREINNIILDLNNKLEEIRKKVDDIKTYQIFRAGPTEVKEVLQILVGVPAKGNTPLKRGLYDQLIGRIYSDFSRILPDSSHDIIAFTSNLRNEIDKQVAHFSTRKVTLANFSKLRDSRNPADRNLVTAWPAILQQAKTFVDRYANEKLKCLFDNTKICKHEDKDVPSIFFIQNYIFNELLNLSTKFAKKDKDFLDAFNKFYITYRHQDIYLIKRYVDSVKTETEDKVLALQQDSAKALIKYIIQAFDKIVVTIKTEVDKDFTTK